MGEIATWAYIKEQTSLGYDTNECPTKKEILAFPQEGKDWDDPAFDIGSFTYKKLGVDPRVLQNFGDNETVLQTRVGYYFYRRLLKIQSSPLGSNESNALTIPKEGGTFTAIVKVGLEKLFKVNGANVVADDKLFPIKLFLENEDSLPDYLTYSLSEPDADGYTTIIFSVTENLSTSTRGPRRICFGLDTEHYGYLGFYEQEAGVETWEYTFTAQNTTLNFPAAGGQSTPGAIGITSTKQKFINGNAVGSAVSVSFIRQPSEDWEHNVEGSGWIADENKSESSRSRTVDYIQDESGKKITVTFAQAAGVKTYGTPTVYLGSIVDIPASGGTAATPTYTYSQLWGWNGKTNDGGTISSGASVVWSENISGSNLGTTAKARTKLGSRTLTVTLNGKSGSASIDVYQAENKIENVTQGGWVVSISANPSTFTEQGGTSQISASARASRTNHWTSGVTSAASDATGTPTLSIPTQVTGFSLSGTTLTVAENTTANQRSVVVRATLDTVYKEVTVTQSAYLVEWKYYFTTSTPTLNFDALGTTQMPNLNSYREKYINGSLVEGSTEGVSAVKDSTTGPIQDVSPSGITLSENTTTQVRTGTVVYKQVGSGKTVTITCNQAAGTITQQWVLREVSGFNIIPAAGGQVVASVESGYYDVINGTPKTWHNEAPEVDTNPGWISLTSVEYANNGYYTVKATGISNGSESSRSGKLTLTNSQKSLQLDIVQSGASIGYNYYFEVTSDFPSVAAAGATPKAVIKSRRYRVVNGVEESSYTLVDVSVFSKPDWTGVLSHKVSSTTGPGADYDVTLPVYENTSESIRRGTVVLQQSGSNKQITLNLNQSAAVVTTRDHIEYRTPLPSSDFNAENQGRSIFLISYRETLINGTVTNKVGVEPTWILSLDTAGSWASLASLGPSPSNPYEFEIELTVEENTTNQTRSGSVMFKNGTEEVENAFAFTQDAASLSWNYYIGFNGNVDVKGYSMSWEYTQFGTNQAQSVNLKCWRKLVINGVESDTEEAAEYEAIFSGVGVDSFTITNTELSGDPTTITVRAYPKSANGSVFDLNGTVQYRIADDPSQSAYLYLTHKPVATVKRWTFQWFDQVESVTMKNVSHDSSAGSISPITIISKCEYLLASNQSQVAYTEYIKPTVDEDTATPVSWGRLLENGMTANNYYDYAYLVDENTEENDRYATRTFTQPGNPSNKRLYLYVTQEKAYEGYLGGRVNNNGPRVIQLNTIKDGNFVGNVDINSGNFYGLGTLAQDAGTIEVNVGVKGTDSTPYTQQVEFTNLKFSESGKPVTISNNSDQSTDYEYSWELYPTAGVPAGFEVRVSLLSSDGDHDDGIRLDIIKKNNTVFSIGTLIGNLTLTPKDPTKLPIVLCAVNHRTFS